MNNNINHIFLFN